MFKKANKEYSVYCNSNISIENVNYTNKEFDELLSLILKQANCDFSIKENIYYIFEIQKKDITKNFKNTKIVNLKFITVENLINIIPSELNNSNFIKVDKNTNSVILNGSNSEIEPILQFIQQVDKKILDKSYKRFDLVNISAKDLVPLIQKSLIYSEIIKYENKIVLFFIL